MAVDYSKLMDRLLRFYDFADKAVIVFRTGETQLLEAVATKAKNVIAIDRNAGPLDELETNLAPVGTQPNLNVIKSPSERVGIVGDVVCFEFCLHEVASAERALGKASSLAPDIVVLDHSIGSEWVYYTAIEERVCRSSEAVQGIGVRRRDVFVAQQYFRDYDELRAKISGQGAIALRRSECFALARDIVIPMKYELVLL